MRVLLVCESFTGGCKRHIVDILNAVGGKGFEIVLAYSDIREPGCERNLPRTDNLATIRVRMLRRPAPLSDFTAAVKLFFLIARGRFDIVHLHSSKAGFLGRIAAAAARIFGVSSRVLYTPHGLSFQVGGLRGRLYCAAEKLVSGLTHRFVAVSEGEKHLIMKHGLASEERTTVIPNSVDCGAYEMDVDEKEPPVVGMMGRLVEQKGAACFVEAAILAAKRLPGIRFLIAGEGPQRSRLKKREAGAGGEIDCCGRLSPLDFLSRVGIVAIPSLWEGLPYVLLEAMAAGRAIIASDIPGISDTLTDCGMLVPPADPAAMAEAIVRLAEDPEERARLGKAARKHAVLHFGMDGFAKQIAALYDEIK